MDDKEFEAEIAKLKEQTANLMKKTEEAAKPLSWYEIVATIAATLIVIFIAKNLI